MRNRRQFMSLTVAGVLAAAWLTGNLVTANHLPMSLSNSSLWANWTKHQTLLERYEAHHHGASSLPVDRA